MNDVPLALEIMSLLDGFREFLKKFLEAFLCLTQLFLKRKGNSSVPMSGLFLL